VERIGVITDAHTNLPATRAALDALDARDCTTVVHLGDAIGIGPHPREVLTLLAERDVACVLGNHDSWFAFGLPGRWATQMSAGELEHQRWTHAQLSDADRQAVRRWSYEVMVPIAMQRVVFLHYARRSDGEFDLIKDPSPVDFERLYCRVAGEIVVFGHDHRPFDIAYAGRRFLSPGSLGCHDRAEARALVLTATPTGGVAVDKVSAPYDDRDLLADFDRREVPDRDFIRRTFITRA
jgi:predicted phosphodiesterase